MKFPKTYDPEIVEEKWIRRWEEKKAFVADLMSNKSIYVILLPPPNVTGILTLGHVLNTAIQDVLIRTHKMQGFEVLWLPGTDHAGIATQNKVEQKLATNGLTRFDLGREKFVQKVWKWNDEYHERIVYQMKKLGLGCDWSREKFTMDEEFSRAVREAFVRLYEKGYIYTDEYIVNYCPRCETVISNEEVENKEIEGKLYYIFYPLEDGGKLEVATSRPETMLGDTALCVHPGDKRYKQFIGKIAKLPLIGRRIPVIDDERVDPEFGTGVVKITPAHDPDDFAIGRVHNLKAIKILDKKGNINENGGKYAGLDRYKAREKILSDLKDLGYLNRIEDHPHSVGHCYRCGTVIEPYISKQWFLRMDEMVEKAREVVEKGKIGFYLPRWKRIYFHWLDNIRPWVISRQLWWGHRIPAYYCRECGKIIVAREFPKECPECGSRDIHQDEDVLDTWFSSWLWPFASFGWPEETKELEVFFPSTILVTGWDIIFLWVARMIMSSLEFMGEVPFKEVYFHGMIRDSRRRPLSKSLGNSPDPLELIRIYGADALRIGILRITPEGKDVIYTEESIKQGRNFLNKVWNATRFLMMNSRDNDRGIIEGINLRKVDRWIISRVMSVIKETEDLINSFKVNEAARLLVSHFWGEFCDWFLEMVKPRIYSENESERRDAISVALWAFQNYLKLLHPFIPFITEEINEILPGTREEIIKSNWPLYDESYRERELEEEMEILKSFVSNIRNIRSEFNLQPDLNIEVIIHGKDRSFKLIRDQFDWISQLTGVKEVKQGKMVPHSAFFHLEGTDVYIPLEGIIDLKKEKERLSKETNELERILQRLERQFSNENFLKKAPREVISQTEKKKERIQQKLTHLQENLKRIS